MKIALLGAAGFLGRLTARALAARPDVREILLVDYDVRSAKRLARSLSPSCRFAMADVSKAPELERLIGDSDAVASAVGPCREYEKAVFLTCAARATPVASIGDAPLLPPERNEIDAAFRTAGVPAVSGCGLLPGWTDLLAAHFPGTTAPTGLSDGPSAARLAEAYRFLFFRPERFGGYAFFRRLARDAGDAVSVPPGAPAGVYFETPDGDRIGLPAGRPAELLGFFRRSLGRLGPAGREFSAALLFWLRGTAPRTAAGEAAVIAGLSPVPGRAEEAVRVEAPDGRIAAVLLAEAAVRLGRQRGTKKGLLPLPDLFGREEALELAKAAGATIVSLF